MLLASDYPIFVALLRFTCAQEFSVGAAVHFGLFSYYKISFFVSRLSYRADLEHRF
jgi:hypothetical protein